MLLIVKSAQVPSLPSAPTAGSASSQIPPLLSASLPALQATSQTQSLASAKPALTPTVSTAPLIRVSVHPAPPSLLITWMECRAPTVLLPITLALTIVGPVLWKATRSPTLESAKSSVEMRSCSLPSMSVMTGTPMMETAVAALVSLRAAIFVKGLPPLLMCF